MLEPELGGEHMLINIGPQHPATGQRAQVPDDLEGRLGVAELHGGDVGEIIVLLLRIIVQPAHDLEQALARDDDGGLAPDDVDPAYRVAKARSQGLRRRVGGATSMRNVMRCDGRRSGGATVARAGDRRARSHKPERVW